MAFGVATAGTVFLDVKPDMKGFASTLGAQTRGMGRKLGKVGLIAGAAMGAGVLAGSKVAVDAAADLGEAVNKTEVVFKGAAESVIEFSETSADSLGISQAAALEAAGGYGAMFQALGLGREPAADLSTSLVKLAADMGSLHNVDPTEMLDKIRAGMSGEMEPLKRFGIVLSETAVKAEAYAEGIAKTGEELTDIEKVQARYSLLMKQSASSHDDFANTAESLPNIQRRLKAQFTDTAAVIGGALLPIMEDFGSQLADFVRSDEFQAWLEQAAEWLRENIPKAIKTAKDIFNALWPVIKTVADWFGKLDPKVAGLVLVGLKFNRVFGVMATSVLPRLTAALGGPLGLGVAGFGVVAVKVDEVIDRFEGSGTMQSAIGRGVRTAAGVIPGLGALFGELGTAVDETTGATRRFHNEVRLSPVEAYAREIFNTTASFVALNPELAKTERYLQGIASAGGMSGGGTGPQARASGGPVSARQTYLVGERGPELFAPRTAGMVVPNHQLGGDSYSVNIAVNGVGMDEVGEEVAGRVFQAITDLSRRARRP